MPRSDKKSHDHRGSQEEHTHPYTRVARATSHAPSTSPNPPGPSVEGDQHLPPAQHQHGAGQTHEQHSGQHHGQPGVIPFTTDIPQTKAEQHQHWLHQQHEREQHQHQHQPGTVDATASAPRDNLVEPQSDLPHHHHHHTPASTSEHHAADTQKEFCESRDWWEQEKSKAGTPKKPQNIVLCRAFAQAADFEGMRDYWFESHQETHHHCRVRTCREHEHLPDGKCRNGLTKGNLEKHYRDEHRDLVLYRCYVKYCKDYNNHGWSNTNGLQKHIDLLIKRATDEDKDIQALFY